MAALFSRSSNRIFRVTLALLGLALVGIPVLLIAWARSPAVTGQHDAPKQPIAFSHKIHVTGLRIDCRYCHSSVERAATAGMPSTATCIPCHNQAWLSGPFFEPVRRSLATGTPIPWVRVNALPDFVYFNHAIHVGNGVGCESCHGRVDRMDRVEQTAPLTMGWCLDCHRDPAPRLRPVAEMVTMGWQTPTQGLARGETLARRYAVRRVITCSGCHR